MAAGLLIGSLAVAADSIAGTAEIELVKISVHQYREDIEHAMELFRDEQYAEAYERLSITARWGDKMSQFILSIAYLQGLGTNIDNVAGTAWLLVAVESENRRWESFLRDVQAAITAEENAAAHELSQRLIAYYGMQAMDVSCRRVGSAASRLRPVTCSKKPGISGHRVRVPKSFPL